jgi:hypothetical protein
MKRIFVLITVITMAFACRQAMAEEVPLQSEDKRPIVFDFEESTQDWMIPDWAYDQGDHVAKEVSISPDYAVEGVNSLAVKCEFPGDLWRAALIEWKQNLDLTGYNTISADIYLPEGAPKNIIKGRIVLTVGDGWLFTAMKEPVFLVPGKWNHISARLETEATSITDWKGRDERRLYKHIDKIRKIAIRIEYDAVPPHIMGKEYNGPIYIDNFRIE